MISIPNTSNTIFSFFYLPGTKSPAMAKEQAQLCKEDYTGWETRSACREYYYCDHGFADVIVSTDLPLL